jgi:two-component system chemotaxis response regulator CheB
MARIRVMVVEDSQTVRRHLVEVLGQDADLEVVGEAHDGEQATQMCRELRPDVITLDLAMPVMDGLAVTEHIMAHYPTPILIISGSHERGELFKTYDALAAGAIDVLDKPRGNELKDSWERSLLSAVKLVSRIKVITHLRGRIAGRQKHGIGARPRSTSAPRVVAIGTSTGGPGALTTVLGSLGPGFPLPVLVVIHLSQAFAAAFASWLAQQVAIPVSMAEDGQPVATAAGKVLLAAPERHLVLKDGVLRYTTDPPLHSCRPAVDVLFQSVAGDAGDRCIGCLLTGMGRDGAQGLLAIRRAGGATIAESEATAVVYGMPREAIQLDAAERVLPLHEIGPQIAQLVYAEQRERRI